MCLQPIKAAVNRMLHFITEGDVRWWSQGQNLRVSASGQPGQKAEDSEQKRAQSQAPGCRSRCSFLRQESSHVVRDGQFFNLIVTSTGTFIGGKLLVLAVQMVSSSCPGAVLFIKAVESVISDTIEPSCSAMKMSSQTRDPL
jgi:hypothetical protein